MWQLLKLGDPVVKSFGFFVRQGASDMTPGPQKRQVRFRAAVVDFISSLKCFMGQ